jgi:hypothetical protein
MVSISEKSFKLILVVCMFTITSLACNLSIFSAKQDAPSDGEISRLTDAPAEEVSINDKPTEKEPAPPISAAENPAVPDCNAFDIAAFNSIIEGTYTFVIQDQLNNCHFESDNGFRLIIGGGKPTSSDEMSDLFDSSFGPLPDSTWESIDDYYLGLAYSSTSVSAQGTSASGHSMMIAATSQPDADNQALKMIFEALAREAAWQLNAQW